MQKEDEDLSIRDKKIMYNITSIGGKSHGLIKRADGDDVFFRYSAILCECFRNFDEGQRVEFSVELSPKGLQAVSVTNA